MFQTLKNAWKLPDIRRKILFVLFILLLYRLGTVIPVPYVDASSFAENFGGTIFDYMNILSGGALGTATVFALGISPYITASIVIQLLTVAFPKLGAKVKNGEEGKKFMNSLTRCVTVALAIVTAIGYYFLLKSNGMVKTDDFLSAAVIVTCYCAGAALVMWLAEKINENGLGNGISLILFANIVAGLPAFIIRLVQLCIEAFKSDNPAALGALAIVFGVILLLVVLALTVFSIFITGSERRIPVQYAKRVVGRKMYGGQSTNLPIKLNMSGVMPVIFASSIVSLPITIMTLCGVSATTKGGWGVAYRILDAGGFVYPICLFLLIVAFAYFYVNISFDPIEVSNNLKKNGGMIPGIRQGRPTADYIRKILSKVTLMGALFLSVIAVLPIIADPLVIKPIIGIIVDDANMLSYFSSSFRFGGTSLLIVIGVALETTRELEGQLTMRNYKGFLN